jgi:hypothetical protein
MIFDEWPSTPKESFTSTQTVSDVTSQLKAVGSESAGGRHTANHISIEILNSMEELQDHAASSSIDSLRAREVSGVLESQINVQNSAVTAKHLRDLTASVDCVYDSLRQLYGRGATEIRVLMEEVNAFTSLVLYSIADPAKLVFLAKKF